MIWWNKQQIALSLSSAGKLKMHEVLIHNHICRQYLLELLNSSCVAQESWFYSKFMLKSSMLSCAFRHSFSAAFLVEFNPISSMSFCNIDNPGGSPAQQLNTTLWATAKKRHVGVAVNGNVVRKLHTGMGRSKPNFFFFFFLSFLPLLSWTIFTSRIEIPWHVTLLHTLSSVSSAPRIIFSLPFNLFL